MLGFGGVGAFAGAGYGYGSPVRRGIFNETYPSNGLNIAAVLPPTTPTMPMPSPSPVSNFDLGGARVGGNSPNGNGKKNGYGGSGLMVESYGGKIRSSGSTSPFGKYGPSANSLANSDAVYWHYNPGPDIFSRKVFVGGLPIDIEEDKINETFGRFGPVVVDWPHKSQDRAYYPPKGYVFLIYENEASVRALVDNCHQESDKYYLCVTSPTMRDKPAQVRPWRLADADFVVDANLPLDPRKSVFVGGVPRPFKAVELATTMDRLFGSVCYAGIDTDPELKYPKGAGRVAFSTQTSYMAAITARFVQLSRGDVDKRVEVKPYVLDDQMCDECDGEKCGGQYAPLFCGNVSCLQYYCEHCWTVIHSKKGRESHKPLVKESTERATRGIHRSSGFPVRFGHGAPVGRALDFGV